MKNLSQPLIVVPPDSPHCWPNAFRFDGTSKSIEELEKRVKRDKPAWLLFEKNEQTNWPIAALNHRFKTGYSSFCGIDRQEIQSQTAACWKDWQNKEKKIALQKTVKTASEPKAKTLATRGTFSLVFDTEQLACVHFGLPRILNLLARHGVRATFFITGVVQQVYSGLAEELRKEGHEVGLHGLYHEYLQALTPDEQLEHLEKQKKQLGKAVGANFIGRMNSYSVKAFYKAGLQYFVFPLKNSNGLPAAYSPPMWTEPGLFAVPVFCETYEKPLEKIQTQIDRTLKQSKRSSSTAVHLTLLLHPFFDGSLHRLPILEKTILHLKKNGFEGLPICESLPQAPKGVTASRLLLRPYGSSGLAGLAERVLNGFSANAYHKAALRGRVLKVQLL